MAMNKNGKPKISVLIPVYNAEKYIARALESVIGQSFRDIEVVCVNDASSDSSVDIINQFIDKDSRIRIITKEHNEGAMKARETAYRNALGEYLFFLDGDDIMVDDILEKLYYEASIKDADIVISDFYYHYIHGLLKYEERTSGITDRPDSYLKGMLKGKSCSLCGHLYHKQLFVDNELINFPISFSEDKILLLQLLKYSKRIAPVPAPSFLYKFNPDSRTMKRLSDKGLRENMFGLTWSKNFYIQEGKFEREAIRKYLKDVSYMIECGYSLKIILEYFENDKELLSFESLRYYLGSFWGAHTWMCIHSGLYKQSANKARMFIRKLQKK